MLPWTPVGSPDLVINGSWEISEEGEPHWVWQFSSGYQKKIPAIQVAADSTNCSGKALGYCIGLMEAKLEDIHKELGVPAPELWQCRGFFTEHWHGKVGAEQQAVRNADAHAAARAIHGVPPSEQVAVVRAAAHEEVASALQQADLTNWRLHYDTRRSSSTTRPLTEGASSSSSSLAHLGPSLCHEFMAFKCIGAASSRKLRCQEKQVMPPMSAMAAAWECFHFKFMSFQYALTYDMCMPKHSGYLPGAVSMTWSPTCR